MRNLKNHLITAKSILIFAVIMAVGLVYADVLQLANKGKTEYVIVESSNPIPAEKFAAKELSSFLQKMTGAEFRIVPEKDAAKAKFAIYVGATDFAAKQGIKPAALHPEEWVIRTVGKNLIISGGRARGTLYGTYEFLERLGCYWFDEITESIPRKPTIAISAFSVRKKPRFQLRMIYTGTKDTRPAQLLRVRNKDTRTWAADIGFSDPGPGHTFYSFSKQFPKNRPEFHAMNKSGERPVATSGSGPGQICLTNPEVRKLMVELLEKYIQAVDKQMAAKIAQGAPKRRFYYITPNDNAFNCQCPPCKAFMEKEGTDSALYVDFINYIADHIKKKYPDVIIGFFAYENNLVPPKRIKPRDNTMVCFAQLNAEWKKKDEFPDLYRAMNHPINKKAEVLLGQWTKICKNVEIWDYWIQFVKNKYPFPNATLDPVIKDMQWFDKHNVYRVFTECENNNKPNLSFHALTCWVARKLMVEPKQDPNRLIKIFMNGYYGPAAGKMTEYLNFLQKSIAATPLKEGKICANLISERSYLNLEFYKKADALLDAAEKLCPKGSVYLLNVQQERVIVDAGIYCMWELLVKQLPKGQKMPWKAADILKRYQQQRLAMLKARPYLHNQSPEKATASEITSMKGFHAAGKGAKPLVMTINRSTVSKPGDPSAVDWSKATNLNQWFTTAGNKVPSRKISGKILMDDKYLYLLLEEKGIDLSKVNPQWWAGDGWELFFTTQRHGFPYKQLAINPEGKQNAFAYTDSMAGQTVWKPGIIIKAEKAGNSWKTLISIPLSGLMTKQEISGNKPFFMNIFRTGRTFEGGVMCLNPIFDASYHDMANLAEMCPRISWPSKEKNLAFGKSYTLSKKPNWKLCLGTEQETMKKLTDGIFKPGKDPMWFDKKHTLGFTHHGNLEFTFDLKKMETVGKVYISCGAGISGVERPRTVQILTSTDGKTFVPATKVTYPNLKGAGYRAAILELPFKPTKARYVKIVCFVANWYLCFDEIAIQSESDAAAPAEAKKPASVTATGWPANNLVSGKSYTMSKKPNWKHCQGTEEAENKKLTDGVFNNGKYPMWFDKKTTLGFAHHGNLEFTFDLGKTAAVEKVFLRCGYGTSNVERPKFVQVFTSMDGKNFTPSGKVEFPKQGNVGYKAETLEIPLKKTDARYVKVACNIVYWYFCMDELAVQGQWK